MPSSRTTLWLLIAVTVFGLLLWMFTHEHASEVGSVSSAPTGQIFTRGFGDVASVIVEYNGFRTDLRFQNGCWRQVEPFAVEVDQTAVRKFLDVLANAPLLERITLEELRRRELQLKDFGLAAAQPRVVIRNANRRIEICFGNKTPDGNEVYLYVDTASQVLVTSRVILDAVPLSLESVRDRALLPGGEHLPSAFELRRANMSYVKLVHADTGWQITQPMSAPADAAAVNGILSGLRQARIEAFITNTTEEASGSLRSRLAFYGLDADSSTQVQFWNSDGPASIKLCFGRPVSGHPGWIYALTADKQSVVAVTNGVLTLLQAEPSDLRDRRLFFNSLDDIQRIQIRFPDQLVECRRDEQRKWTLVAPLQDAADQDHVDRLLLGLLRLRASQIIEPQANAIPGGASTGTPVSEIELSLTSRVVRAVITPDARDGWMDVVFTNAPTRYLVATSNIPPAALTSAAAYGLRDRMVMSVATASVRRISIQRGEIKESVERTLDGDVWQVAGNPSGKAVSQEGLASWLMLCANMPSLRIECLGMGARTLDGFGLENPWMQMDVDLSSAEALRKVLLVGGNTREGGRYAMLRGHDVIFVLSPATVRMLECEIVQTNAVPATAVIP